MSALAIHARAARILGESLKDLAEFASHPNDRALLHHIGDAHIAAADRMLGEAAADAKALDPRCTIDHKGMKSPRCTACGAPRGS